MATKQELEKELQDVKDQLKNISMSQIPSTGENMGDQLMKELGQLSNKAGRTLNNAIPYRSIDDHKNIPLYTELNKVIGPLHPVNAKQTMERFYAAGYPLFVAPRTPEQIEAYKQTDRYKKREAKIQADRQRIQNKKPSVQIERFAKIIASETGRSIKALTALPEKE